MQINEMTLITTDGIKLYAKEWTPDQQARAVVVLVHGLGEHIGRYEHVAKAFTDAGYVFFGFDLRGHGKSEGLRGDAPSYAQLMSDIDLAIKTAEENHPGLPSFLYGHSFGGAQVLYFAENCVNHLNGAIVTSPGLAPTEPVPMPKYLLGKLMYMILPTFRMASALDAAGLSRNASVGEKYLADPMVHPYITARLGLDLLNAGKSIIDNAPKIHLPLLLLQGTEDRLTNPPKTAEFAAKAPKSLITYSLYPGLYHELHNEPEQSEVFGSMFDWMNEHLN